MLKRRLLSAVWSDETCESISLSKRGRQ